MVLFRVIANAFSSFGKPPQGKQCTVKHAQAFIDKAEQQVNPQNKYYCRKHRYCTFLPLKIPDNIRFSALKMAFCSNQTL